MKRSRSALSSGLGLGCLATALTLTLLPNAAAQPGPAAPPMITTAAFEHLPNGAVFERFYPQAARDQGVSGRVRVQCTVSQTGTLIDCQIVSEDPKGWGFGEATLRLAGEFRVRPATADGAPTANGVISFPVVWRMDGPPPIFAAPQAALFASGGAKLSESMDHIWAARPSAAAFMAERPGQGGFAVLSCRVNREGGLSVCGVNAESTADAGAAAARLSRAYRVNPIVAGRDTKGAIVVFRVDFDR
jgi:TonB family protein